MKRVVVLCVVLLSGCDLYSDAAITTSSLPDGQVGQSYSFTLQGKHVDRWSVMGTVGVGVGDDIVWSGAPMPPGIRLSEQTGTFSGTPTLAGLYTFNVRAYQAPSGYQSPGACGTCPTWIEVLREFSLAIKERQ